MEITLAEKQDFTFHEIQNSIAAVFAAMDEAENPDDPEYREALAAVLADLADAEASKVDALAWVLAGLEAKAEQARITEMAIANRRRAIENRAASLKSYALKVMQAHGIKQIKGQSATFSIRKGVESVQVDPIAVDALPFDLVRTKVEPDNPAIKKALQAGREIAGACLVVGPETLNIRR